AGSIFDGHRPVDPRADGWVEAGLLTCSACRTWFPVIRGVPVLLPYTTPAHQEFSREHMSRIATLAMGCSPANGTAVRGERLVMQSFSAEWLDYDFDGVIWEMDYADHEQRFLKELGGCNPQKVESGRFLEVGCGLGITTAMAQKNYGGEAVGVDLSLAAWRAAATHRDNPALHFVQASVFALPFEAATFDTIYTRGVLHHTYSTYQAYRALAPLCRPGGLLYVWVYGPKSINDNLFRRAVYGSEVVMRFVSNRCPAWLSTASLAPFALSYLIFNRLRRRRDPRIQPYNYVRALHAARDRYTPEFAHRHDADEVCRWFREAGYTELEVVDWRDMPSADHDDYRRNTGVRGRRAVLALQQEPAWPPSRAVPDAAQVLHGVRQHA
ncbi:MAG TPA: methyltransferase domain-containing protein, partial [Burkholderiales bacterium]